MVASALSICTYLEVFYGYGDRFHTLTPDNIVHLAPIDLAVETFFLVASPATKLSICATYRRVFNSTQHHYFADFMILLLVITCIPITFLTIFQCRNPVNTWWFSVMHGGTCMDFSPSYYVNVGVSIFTDIGIILFAYPRVIWMNIPRRQKIALIGVVSIGWLAVICVIIRVAMTVNRIDHSSSFDPTWTLPIFNIWSAIELHVSIFCASCIGINPLITKFAPRLLAATNKSQSECTMTLNVPEISVDSASQERGDSKCSEGKKIRSMQTWDAWAV